MGSVVTIIDSKMDSIWNVKNLQEPYKTVSEEMHKLVTSHDISSIFLNITLITLKLRFKNEIYGK